MSSRKDRGVCILDILPGTSRRKGLDIDADTENRSLCTVQSKEADYMAGNTSGYTKFCEDNQPAKRMA